MMVEDALLVQLREFVAIAEATAARTQALSTQRAGTGQVDHEVEGRAHNQRFLVEALRVLYTVYECKTAGNLGLEAMRSNGVL